MRLENAAKSEDVEQILVVQWAQNSRNRYPELEWLFHCPNGGKRNRMEAVRFRQMGVKPGVSDLCLPYPKGAYHGLFIEMKYGSNRKTEDQKRFLDAMEKAGHYVATCYSAEMAVGVLREYLGLGDGGRMSMPNNSILKGGAGSRIQEAEG